MPTLHQTNIQYNTNYQLSNKGGKLSSDGGLILVKEFMKQINFEKILEKFLSFKETRKYHAHSQHELFQQLLLQQIAGYNTDAASNILRKDPLFSDIFNLSTSQPTFSRFINEKDHPDNKKVHDLMTRLGELLSTENNQRQAIIDIDSTHSDIFGKQENSDFNGHYKTNGYHPLLAFEQTTGALLGAQLRSGNQYTSKNAETFLEPILDSFIDKEIGCLVRGDSGFAKSEIYQLCDQEFVKFIIRLKASQKLKK
ncbi:IS1380 family transposase [Vagococcus fluvialis]|uniref:IS1380 family transposase n=1 Tax=Vagococcus fluvialis TaxID=2738 RepID=UPI003D137D95